MALAGLMQTLSIEGEKHNIRVNCLAPTAATRMTEGLMPEAVLQALDPSAVVPAMLVMASDDAPNRTIICAGAGSFEVAHITLTQGVYLGTGPDTAERLAAAISQVSDRTHETVPRSGSEQGTLEVGKAMAAHAAV
jgi:NAD(P)-dependent dehydrogenase (short-subunit alcohol dehydrogenase family)